MTPFVDRSRSRLSATIEALWYGPPSERSQPPVGAAAEDPLQARFFRTHLFGAPLFRALLLLLLLPLTILTALISRHRFSQIQTAKKARHEQRAMRPPPVVIVGNLLAGGTGKTPVVIAIARALQARGWQTGLIARGAGASLAANDAKAFLNPPDFRMAGDEATLMARRAACPIAIGRQRAQALQKLLVAAPTTEIIISDDGLQHRGLPRDLELIVFDQRGLGNGHLLPAGPLREPPLHGLQSDAVLLRDGAPDPIGHPTRFAVATRVVGWWSFNAPDRHLPDSALLEWIRGRRTTVVTGIARPERFFDRLREIGLQFDAIALADHAPIDLVWLRDLPADCILMTEKDAVKCEKTADPRIRVLRIEAVIPPSLIDFIEERLFGRPTA
jgi:tetraacyldisaccharide 4'-kinase